MAVVKNANGSVMALKLQKGVTSTGAPAYVTRNYPCKATAADQDIYDVAVAIAGLQNYPVDSIQRTDNANLVEA